MAYDDGTGGGFVVVVKVAPETADSALLSTLGFRDIGRCEMKTAVRTSPIDMPGSDQIRILRRPIRSIKLNAKMVAIMFVRAMRLAVAVGFSK